MRLRFESTIPKNVVDQMNDTLVQNMDLLYEQACMSNLNKCNSQQNQKRASMHNTKGQSLQFNLSIHKCIQTGLVGRMQQTHVKMFFQERTHSLIQHEEQENLLMDHYERQ